MVKRLTETAVKALPSPPKGHKITYDTDLKGFGVRVTAARVKAFVLNYRSHGRERRLTIGSYPEWSAAAARKQAEALKRQIDLGHDPLAQRREERDAPTLADLCQLYEERHLPRKRTSSQREDRAIIKAILLPRFGKERLSRVRYRDIEALHRELSARAPYRANRVVALLSKMFSLAIKWELAEENPAKGIERNPENNRTRYLSAEELERLLSALSSHQDQSVANAIRFMMLTGARRREVLSAIWEQFDLNRGLWVKPAATTKQAREHRLPLSEASVLLLREMAAGAKGKHLFPGKLDGQPLTDIKKSWASICRRAGLENVRLHDLRHSFASYLVSNGHSLPTIGALLGHTQASTTQRYAHLLDDPLRTAANHIGGMVKRAQS
jgi:integrase